MGLGASFRRMICTYRSQRYLMSKENILPSVRRLCFNRYCAYLCENEKFNYFVRTSRTLHDFERSYMKLATSNRAYDKYEDKNKHSETDYEWLKFLLAICGFGLAVADCSHSGKMKRM